MLKAHQTQIISVIAGIIVVLVCVSISQINVRKIEVSGHHPHVSLNGLRVVLEPIRTKNWWTIDHEAIEEQLSEFAWIKQVEIKKLWPAVISITLTEHRPKLKWQADKILTDNGQWFYVTEQDAEDVKNLPLLKASTANIQVVSKYWSNLWTTFHEAGNPIKIIQITPWGSWQIELQDGLILVFDEQAIPKKIKQIAKFIQSEHYVGMVGKKQFDLRYNNGFALKDLL